MVTTYKPQHIKATTTDFNGNNNIGRYLLISGSRERTYFIANNYFKNIEIRKNERGHDLLLGDLITNEGIIKVATISSGMGAPSMDIIINELILLGARRFIRIGTASPMQPYVRCGDLVFASGAIRDEDTSSHYVVKEAPALADLEMLVTAYQLIHEGKLNYHSHNTHFGLVHSKSSLFARELFFGPKVSKNKIYMEELTAFGVLASEMECSQLFILSQLYKNSYKESIKSCAILSIIGDYNNNYSADEATKKHTIAHAIEFALLIIKTMHKKSN